MSEFAQRYWLGKPLAIVEGRKYEVVGIDWTNELILPGVLEYGDHPVYGYGVRHIHRTKWRKPLPGEGL